MWLVILKKQTNHPYPLGYWPRKFEHKSDAEHWIKILESDGGEAELTTLEFALMRKPEDRRSMN
jgi:hypothetical protein